MAGPAIDQRKRGANLCEIAGLEPWCPYPEPLLFSVNLSTMSLWEGGDSSIRFDVGICLYDVKLVFVFCRSGFLVNSESPK